MYLPFTATARGNVEFIIGGTIFLVVLLAATALVLIGIVKMALLLRKLNDQIPNRSVSNNFYISTHIHAPTPPPTPNPTHTPAATHTHTHIRTHAHTRTHTQTVTN